MYNYIILSSTLFGSVYLCSLSLYLINTQLSEQNKVPSHLKIMNYSVFIISGSVFTYALTRCKYLTNL